MRSKHIHIMYTKIQEYIKKTQHTHKHMQARRKLKRHKYRHKKRDTKQTNKIRH